MADEGCNVVGGATSSTSAGAVQQTQQESSDGTLPPVPTLDHYMYETGYHKVRNAKRFVDLNLSDAAAGFVSYQPCTSMLRRWPGRALGYTVALGLVAMGAMYWPLRISSVDAVDSPITTPITVAASKWISAAVVLIAMLVAKFGHPRMGTLLMALSFFVGAISLFTLWLIWAFQDGNMSMTVHRSVQIIIRLLGVAVLVFREDKWVVAMILGIILVMVTAVALQVLYGYRGARTDMALATIFLISWLYLVTRRAWALRKARLATKPDQLRYDEVWKEVSQTKQEDLKLLAGVVMARKQNRVMQPFYSLDHIFQHAYSLNAWYQQVVVTWADACGARAVTAKVKSLERTLEKVQRCYRGRIPPVIDLVRASIVVDDVGDARKVLEYVLARIICHQVKNRFDLKYNGNLTAGYRDINLHHSFKELQSTPHEGFVFELQIHYAPILSVKTDEGHKRYIAFRNLRGD